jgi:hypothetical protein
VSGVEVLIKLINVGLLDPPVAIEGTASKLGAPPLRTGQADSMLARQAGTLGQCFHFMAEGDDANHELAELNVGDRTELIHPNTARVAYQRCMDELVWLLDEALSDPKEARLLFHGLYAMMHSVADSFSRAHVERAGLNNDGAIIHLRPWRLVTFQKIFVHRAIFTLYFDDSAYHKISDPRDEDYLEPQHVLTEAERLAEKVDASLPDNCAEYYDVDPNLVPRACLSPSARRAAEALEQLLRLSYEFVVRKCDSVEVDRERGGDSACGRQIWASYVTQYMPFEEHVTTRRHPSEIVVSRLFGATMAVASHDQFWGLRADSVSPAHDDHNPALIIPRAFASAGVRTYSGASSFSARIGTDLVLPLSGRLTIGFTAMSLLLSVRDPWEFSMNSQLGFVDTYLAPVHLWLRLAGPDWNLATFVKPPNPLPAVASHEWVSLTIGRHFDDEAPTRVMGTGGVLSRHVDEDWSPRLDVPTERSDVANVISATMNDEHDRVLASVGYEDVDSFDRFGRTRLVSAGWALSLGLLQRQYGSGIRRYGVLSPQFIGRFQVGWFFVDAVPLVEGGYGTAWYGDAGIAARLGIQLIGRLQIRVRSPRWSVVDQGRFNGEIFGLEFGFRCWPQSRVCL